jgi:hypothetical protein
LTTDQINELIAKYGRPAFELAMRQVYIDAGIGATVAIIAGGIALALGFAGLRQWRIYKAFTGPYYRSEADVAAYLFWAGAIIAALIGLLFLAPVFSLLNPEFAALQKLLPGGH